ncbi:fad binding domain-containing [Pyrenophora seminiperda CCB06]|uniref:Fad binding domain-containing n=1 Tax=Pyrenophora seminiperda CCB06 TaxID=1302712 RepID=A0A3M7MFD5_9PLEO|nr:fad binding domain-containing [Pyrenophora seminiperda CCB06]
MPRRSRPSTMAPSPARAGRPNNNALLLIMAVLSAIGLYCMRIGCVVHDYPIDILEGAKMGILPNTNGVRMRKEYTGIKQVDEPLGFLVTAFLYGPTKWNEPFYWQQVHFLTQLAVIIAIMNVEACRERNQGSWLKYTAMFTFVYQNIGGAVMLPIWWLLLHRLSGPKSYFGTGRTVPLQYARLILPGTILLYLLPTLAMFLPYDNLSTLESAIAFWQFSPILVNIPLWLASLFTSSPSPSSPKTKNADLLHLKMLYAFLFILSVAVHWYTIAGIANSPNPDVSGARVFVPSTYTYRKSIDWGLLFIFQCDWLVVGASCLIAAWVAVTDVQRLRKGAASGENLLEGFIVVVTVAIGGGPGAALAAVWFWRREDGGGGGGGGGEEGAVNRGMGGGV